MGTKQPQEPPKNTHDGKPPLPPPPPPKKCVSASVPPMKGQSNPSSEIQVIPIGHPVVIGQEVRAIVTGICIRDSQHVTYECSWWNGNNRCCEWLHQTEVSQREQAIAKIGFCMTKKETAHVRVQWEQEYADGSQCIACGDKCWSSMWRMFMFAKFCGKKKTSFAMCGSCRENVAEVNIDE